MRRQLRAIEIARAALIEVEEIAVIDPFEVEQQPDRLAYANVGEDRSARVEHEIATVLRHSGRQRLLEHAAVAHGGKIVGSLPAARIVLVAQVVEAALERFQVRIGLTVIIEADLVKV